MKKIFSVLMTVPLLFPLGVSAETGATRNGCFHAEQSMNANETCFWDQGGYAGWVRTMKKVMVEDGNYDPKDLLEWKRFCLNMAFSEVGDPVSLADCEEKVETAVRLGYIGG